MRNDRVLIPVLHIAHDTTIVPTKSDSHVIFCLQLPSV